jgi:Holliday junction resolvase RusA-like endonuclease
MNFIIPIEPMGKQTVRVTRNGTFNGTKTRHAMREIAESIRGQYKGEPLDCPLCVVITAWRTRPKTRAKDVWADTKPDYDNIEKLLGDALEGILWVNDSRIVDGRCVKKYAPPGVPGWIELDVSECLECAS